MEPFPKEVPAHIIVAQLMLLHLLTEDLIEEIVARLPVKSFLRARSLCKAMRDLAHKSIVVDKHLKFSSQRNPSLLLTDTRCKGKGYNLNRLYFVENEETPNRYSCNELSLRGQKFDEFRVMGSCNGLICLVHPRKRYEICICNPCTGERMDIPPPVTLQDKPDKIVIGFGVVPMTNTYKVVAIIDFSDFGDSSRVQQKVFVYTLGGLTWGCKDNTTSYLKLPGQSVCKPFVNGALHWVTADNAKHIVSFNMDAEEFDFIPRPDELKLDRGSFSLRSFKGKLLILNTSFGDRIEIWEMKNYGVVESWTRTFTVNEHHIKPNIRNFNISRVEIVCFLEDWEVYLVQDHGRLFRYNLQTKSVRELIGIDDLPNWFDAIAHVGTLVSPRRVAEEELNARLDAVLVLGG